MNPQVELTENDLFQGLSIIHLKIYGVWDAINYFRAEGTRSLKYNLYAAMVILSAFPYVFFQFMCIFYVQLNMQVIIFLYLTIVPIFQVAVKIAVFWFRFEDQSTLFELLKEDFLVSVPLHKRPFAKKVYKKVARRYNAICILIFVIHFSTIFIWMVTPGMDAGNGRKKILGGWYPFAFAESPWFEAVFAYEIVLICWHGSLVSVYECAFLQLLMALQGHFVVLNHHISTLRKSDIHLQRDGSWTEAQQQEYLNTELAKAMEDYDKLLRYKNLTGLF